RRDLWLSLSHGLLHMSQKMAWKYREFELMKQHEMDQLRMTLYTNISHDLRTPISLILSPLGVLLKSQSYPEIKEDLELIYRNACQLNDEVDQLLDLRRIECQQAKLSLTYGDFAQYLREIVVSFEKIILNHGLSLEVHIPQYKINFEFDGNKMSRIISNILSNAIKYNTPNGKIKVSLEYIQENGEENALIKVADTGIGIDECNRMTIFERFYREEKSLHTKQGSGIGLHIAKQYVELHGGSISVEPNKPQGSVFLISLPMHHQDPSGQLEEDEELDAYGEEFFNSEKTSIMVVEDNEDFRKFLVKCLMPYYTVYEATNGNMAWDLLRRKPVQLVVSDVMMPKVSGIELCEKMKNDVHFSHIPVILLSALQSEQHVKDGLKSGAFDYVSKPVDIDFFLLRVKKALAFVKDLREKLSQSISPTEVNSLEIESIDKKFLTRTIGLIQDNISNLDYSVEQLSQDLAISRSGFYKKMLLLAGKTPVIYIRDYKMQKALEFLASGEFSISEVAYKVGYVPKQFTRVFKEVYGSTPSDYLKKANAEAVEATVD
ncbi:MAG: response regulator, partial [Clostridiales bacterium]|nr:response regulator [Clostridiales bacterium]MCC8115247.1 response regulator [Bacteroidales bacterium]